MDYASLMQMMLMWQQMRRQQQSQQQGQTQSGQTALQTPQSAPPQQTQTPPPPSLLNTAKDPDPDPGLEGTGSSTAVPQSGMSQQQQMGLVNAIGSAGSNLGTLLGAHPVSVQIPNAPPMPPLPQFSSPQVNR